MSARENVHRAHAAVALLVMGTILGGGLVALGCGGTVRNKYEYQPYGVALAVRMETPIETRLVIEGEPESGDAIKRKLLRALEEKISGIDNKTGTLYLAFIDYGDIETVRVEAQSNAWESPWRAEIRVFSVGRERPLLLFTCQYLYGASSSSELIDAEYAALSLRERWDEVIEEVLLLPDFSGTVFRE